ncbi:MAG TPA: histidine phosphatase family protein, partial [Flavobacteriaceae bacterium]|nr:histidine phosphatase family protein [Flavobacteriaceae bacterium]
MKKVFPFLLLLVIACKNDPKQKDQPENLSEEKMEFTQKNTTYYFIRHAEKDLSEPTNNDPHLTEEGLKRAAFWAKYFADKNIDKIYSTNYSRTIQT